MSTNFSRKTAYGLSDPTINVPNGAIVSKRDPRDSDRAPIGTEWVNTIANTAFILTSIEDNTSNWEPITSDTTVTLVDASQSPYTVVPSDFLIDVDSSGGSVTIQLPDIPLNGKYFIIKDLTGSAATNNIIVTTVSGSTTIDGATSYTISTNYQSIQVTRNAQDMYDISLGYTPTGGGSSSLQFDLDIGSTTSQAGAITFNAFEHLGQTPRFRSSSPGEIILNGSDGNENTLFGGGGNVGSGINNGANNSGLGWLNLSNLHNSSNNCAIGYSSLALIDVGALVPGAGSDNSALGTNSLSALVDGAHNIAIGSGAGANYTSNESNNMLIANAGTLGESNKLRIGSGTGTGTNEYNQAFVSGIQTIVVTGTAVLVSSSDQLGVASSSARFKSNIQDMGDSSDVIYKLRPVTFNWDRFSAPGLMDASDKKQFGLIAEEVAEVFPQIVTFEKDGKPLNVNYVDLVSLLLNEIQVLKGQITRLAARVDELEIKSQ